jgi:hypothetical protein
MKRSVYLQRASTAHSQIACFTYSFSRICKSFLAIFVLGFLCTLNAAAQQSLPAENSKSLSADSQKIKNNGYFSYQITGNADVDAENYKKAKENFVANHPAEYQKMINESASGKSAIDKNEFEKLPKEKQQHILANPNKYEIIELPPK